MKLRFVLGIVLLGVLASAQDVSQPARRASLEGMVVNEPGDQPLKKVLVQVLSENQKQPNNYSTTTESDGRFRIENVQPGDYRIYLEKTGYQEITSRGHKSEGEVFSVQAGQSLQELLFRMMPTAVIMGRVVDEDGEPMAGVNMFVRRKKPGKELRLETSAAERTNDLGEYRFSGLFPGQYFVVAMPPPDFRDLERDPAKPAEAESKPDTRYVTTYYPSTSDAAQASAITVQAGDEMPISMTLIPASTYRVRGVVTGVAAGQKPTVELVSKAGDVMLRAIEVTADNRFEVSGVAPGSYVVRALTSDESQALTARQDVNVVAADVDGIKLVPVPSFVVSGHFRLEGHSQGDTGELAINLRAADAGNDPGFFISQDYFGENARLDRMGNFQWKNVNPGSYIVQLFGSADRDIFLKSVTVGSAPTEGVINLSGPTVVELVASSNACHVEGVVLDHDRPVGHATVVAVPEEKFRKLPMRFGVSTTDQKGAFTIRGLAPGSYTLFAWQDLESDLYYDADFLKSQAGNGASLKVEEGARPSVELKLSPVGERWQ